LHTYEVSLTGTSNNGRSYSVC